MTNGYYHLNAHCVHEEGFSVNGTMSAHLQTLHAKYVAQSRKHTVGDEATSSSELDQPSKRGQAVVMKRKARAMQESRMARIEALRAQVRTGTYQVDSTLLAQRILEDGTHFMDSSKG